MENDRMREENGADRGKIRHHERRQEYTDSSGIIRP